MCKGSNTTTSTSQPPASVIQSYQTANNAATIAAQNPYQYYQGQLVANLNPTQTNAISSINNAQGIANPYLNAASTLDQSATQPIGASQINQYMNPYISDVVGTTANEINQNNAIQQQQLQGNAASLGALGGDRVGVAQSALANQQDLAENNTLSGLYSSGYNTALGAAQTTNAQQLQGAALDQSLGTTAQNAALTGASAELQAGATEQQQQQNELNAAYSQWTGAQQYPYQSSQFLADVAEGLGSQQGGTASTTTPPPSEFSQIVGGIGSIAGIAGSLKRGGRANYDGGGGVVPYEGNSGAVPSAVAGADYFPALQNTAGGASTLPAPPAAIVPQQANSNGGSGGSGGSGGAGGAGLGALIKKLNSGGRISYDDGGDVPYSEDNGIAPQNEFGGGGYFPKLSGVSIRGAGPPKAPAAQSQNGSQQSANQAAQVGGDIATTIGHLDGKSTALNSDSPPSELDLDLTGLWNDPSLVTAGTAGAAPGLGGLYAKGGRTRKASGGSSLDTGSPDLYEEMTDYQMASGLLPGNQAPKIQYQQQQPAPDALEEDEQAEGQPMARGGLTRLGRASGGASALPAFTPVGGQSDAAPQPATTTGTQPSTWGNVALPTAPQLAVQAPGTQTGADITNQVNTYQGNPSLNQNAADPYVSYIQGLAGSNPSIGNHADNYNHILPAPAWYKTPSASSNTATSDAANATKTPILGGSDSWLNAAGLAALEHPAKTGGRIHRDFGGPAPDATDQSPISLTTGLATPTPVQSSPLPSGVSPNYVAKVNDIESGGNPTASNPRSTASGLGGITTPTFEAVAQQTNPALVQGKTPAQISAEKATPAISNDTTTALAALNAKYLAANNLPVNDGTLYIAHNFGAGGAKALLTADPSAPASSVLPKEDMTANPDLDGLTVGQVIQKRMAEMGISPTAQVTPAQESQTQGGWNPQLPNMGDDGLGAIQPGLDQQRNIPQYQQGEVQHMANSPWAALAAAGFATMAGTSPFPGVNIGQGGLAGLNYLQNTQDQDRQNATTTADIAQQGAQTNQAQQNLALEGVRTNQAEQMVQANYDAAIKGLQAPFTQAQISAAYANYGLSQIGAPQVPTPVSPYGAPSGVTQTSTPPATPYGASNPQPTTGRVIDPNAPPPNNQQNVTMPDFAQQATNLPPTAPATVSSQVMGPTGQQMQFQQAYSLAQRMLAAPQTAPMAQNWLSSVAAPALNSDAVGQLQTIANAGQQQTAQLDELAQEALKTHTGPISGNILAKAYQSYEDLASAWKLPVDPNITAASDATQLIPKLSATIGAAMTKMASDVGGSETYKLMSPSIPTMANTNSGLVQLVRAYNTLNERSSALANYVQTATTQGIMPYNQAVAAFNQQYPPAMWASHVAPVPMPDTVSALQPGFVYQQGGRAFMWDGSQWQTPQ